MAEKKRVRIKEVMRIDRHKKTGTKQVYSGMEPLVFMIKTSAGRWLAVVILALLLGGCGYHFSEVSGSRDGIRKIYVGIFLNRTDVAYLENIFRNAMIDQFVRSNIFQVVGEEADADAVVSGRILRISTRYTAYEETDLGMEERIYLSVQIVFEDRETGRTLWEDRNFSGAEDYLVRDAVRTGKREALIKLSQDMAERAYRLMIADF